MGLTGVRIAKRYSKNQNIFVGFSEMLKKTYGEKLSNIAFISFHGRMLKSKNLKMGTSSKAQFTLTVRTVSVHIAKENVLMAEYDIPVSVHSEISILKLWPTREEKAILFVKDDVSFL